MCNLRNLVRYLALPFALFLNEFLRNITKIPVRFREILSHLILDGTVPLPKSNLLKRNLLYAGPKLWNSLPNELQAVHNLYTFKQSLKNYILNNEINELV